MNKILEKSLLKKIERLEAFEEKMYVVFEKMSIRVSDKSFNIFFELHPKSGTSLKERVKIECVIYNNEGSILEKENVYIYEDSFFGFEVIEFNIYHILDEVDKIRIFPKKW